MIDDHTIRHYKDLSEEDYGRKLKSKDYCRRQRLSMESKRGNSTKSRNFERNYAFSIRKKLKQENRKTME